MNRPFHCPMRRRDLLIGATLAAAALTAGAAASASYPDHSVKLVVPFPPGGGSDVIARLLADLMQTQLGQPVVIDNRPGAAGVLGTASVVRAPAHGYTLLFANQSSQIIAPLLQDRPAYDGVQDFAPVALLVRSNSVLLASSAFPGRTLDDFIRYAKARPGRLNYGSAGVGSANHLLIELLKARTGMDLTHVPYKGAAPAAAALAADEVQLLFDTVPSAQNWLRQGKVKVLAVVGDARLPEFPDVPTLRELDLLDGDARFWMGLVAPRGTPGAVVQRLQQAAAHAMVDPRMVAFLATNGGTADVGGPEVFASLLAQERARWSQVVRTNGIRAER